MNEKWEKSSVQGVGKAPNNIFCSSKGWEMQPLRFFILPKFGKSDFPHFLVFPILGKYFLLIFVFPSRGKSVFCCFLVFPYEGKLIFTVFFFSLVKESRFSLFPCSSYPYEALFFVFFAHRRGTKPCFLRFSSIVPLRKLLFSVFR